MTLPVGVYRAWTPEEEAMVDLVGTVRQAYQVYVRRCVEANLQARTKKAFEHKRQRLMRT